jgi:uncharacterized protein (DUF488 family)
MHTSIIYRQVSSSFVIIISTITNTIYTIGHLTHPIEEFIKIIQAYNIEVVIDVRTITKSKYVPQFNEEVLDKSLNI